MQKRQENKYEHPPSSTAARKSSWGYLDSLYGWLSNSSKDALTVPNFEEFLDPLTQVLQAIQKNAAAAQMRFACNLPCKFVLMQKA